MRSWSVICKEYRARKVEKDPTYRGKVSKANVIRNRECRRVRREWLDMVKRETGCRYCGIKDPLVLDYHHKDKTQKVVTIAQAVGRNWTQNRILEEIAKCDLLCANCHSLAHALIRGSEAATRTTIERRKKTDSLIGGRGCSKCGFSDISALHFHHKNNKTIGIAKAIHSHIDISLVRQEVLKCDLLCANCHRVEHRSNRALITSQEPEKLPTPSASEVPS